MGQGDEGGFGLLTGESGRSVGGDEAFPLTSLYDAEIDLIQREQPAERDVFRDDMVGVAMEQMRGQMFDPAGEKYKVDFLAEWVMKDGGVTAPHDFLNVIMQASKAGAQRWPHLSPLDAAYRLARESRAFKDMEEARRVG